jgi:DNA polymerase/3'-5' exonuclease PolX
MSNGEKLSLKGVLRDFEEGMELNRAKTIAQEIVARLKPNCQRIEVAGSIRRGKSWVKDIDLVLIPKNQGKLAAELMSLGKFKTSGNKAASLEYKGISVDLYFATPDTWATLLLIRTGSASHNRKLASLAKRRGWHLYANGRGLYDSQDNRIAGDSEESFFKALEMPFCKPEDRN